MYLWLCSLILRRGILIQWAVLVLRIKPHFFDFVKELSTEMCEIFSSIINGYNGGMDEGFRGRKWTSPMTSKALFQKTIVSNKAFFQKTIVSNKTLLQKQLCQTKHCSKNNCFKQIIAPKKQLCQTNHCSKKTIVSNKLLLQKNNCVKQAVQVFFCTK